MTEIRVGVPAYAKKEVEIESRRLMEYYYEAEIISSFIQTGFLLFSSCVSRMFFPASRSNNVMYLPIVVDDVHVYVQGELISLAP